MSKKNNLKPEISVDIKNIIAARAKTVEVKIGLTRATEIELDTDDFEAALNYFKSGEMNDQYFRMQTQKKHDEVVVACVVSTLPEPEEVKDDKGKIIFRHERWNFSDGMAKADKKNNIPDEKSQCFSHIVKCEASPKNGLKTWYSQIQIEPLDYDRDYIYFGLLQEQITYSEIQLDKNGNPKLDAKKNPITKKIYLPRGEEDKVPIGTRYFDNDTLRYIDFLDLN